MWNKAACFKHVWNIDQKKDSLWLKWVHHVYLKGGSIWEHDAPLECSWTWRKLISIVKDVKDQFQQQQPSKYSIAIGYKLFSEDQRKVQWDRQVWNRWNYPKHSFISWLAVQDRLATRERVSRFTQLTDICCVFCKYTVETVEHLFFRCRWVHEGLRSLQQWLNWATKGEDLRSIFKECQRSKLSKFRQQVILVGISALVYSVWKARNLYIWEDEEYDMKKIMVQIKKNVKTRVTVMQRKRVNCMDEEWFELL